MEVNKIICFIEENLYRSLSLNQISSEIGYSKFYISRSFNIGTNMSIPDYYLKRRLSEAAIMITKSNSNLTEIGLRFGFNSSAYFTKKFKEQFGITPSEYKKGSGYIYLQRKLEIGEKKMYDNIEQQISYITENVGTKTDIHTLLSQLENTILMNENEFIIEYITTTKVSKSSNNFGGHIIWEVKLNILTSEFDSKIIRNTSYLDSVDIISIYKEDNEIIVEAKNNITNEIYKSKIIASKPRKFMVDFYNFDSETLILSKKLVNEAPIIDQRDIVKRVDSTLFKCKNSHEYKHLIENDDEIISHSYIGSYDVITITFKGDKSTTLVTMVIDLKNKRIGDQVINSIAGRDLMLRQQEKDIFELRNDKKKVCLFRFVRGRDFYRYNSKYRIKNLNGNNDIY